MRRLVLVAALCLSGLPALAADVTGAWVEQLKLDGYERITIKRTWLGRMRIVAERGEIEREIVINRRTGEVLRDYSRHEDGTIRLPLGFEVELGDDGEDDDDHGEDRKNGKDQEDDDGDEDDSEDSKDSEDGGESDESDESDEDDDD
ncbi:MAG: hypothetical protein QNJ44_02140 [Rhodobacter sp.]|nr:hypothetical protein [Rhodobacter sp.]